MARASPGSQESPSVIGNVNGKLDRAPITGIVGTQARQKSVHVSFLHEDGSNLVVALQRVQEGLMVGNREAVVSVNPVRKVQGDLVDHPATVLPFDLEHRCAIGAE